MEKYILPRTLVTSSGEIMEQPVVVLSMTFAAIEDGVVVQDNLHTHLVLTPEDAATVAASINETIEEINNNG